MPQVKYSNFRLHCLQICVTNLKSHREALLFPFENVLCCKPTCFSCNGYVTTGSVAVCDVITGDRNKIDWRSELVLVTLKMQCNSVTQAVLSMTQLVMVFCPTTFHTCALAILEFLSPSSSVLKRKNKPKSKYWFCIALRWKCLFCTCKDVCSHHCSPTIDTRYTHMPAVRDVVH